MITPRPNSAATMIAWAAFPAARYIYGFSILAYYLLPATLWATLSPGALCVRLAASRLDAMPLNQSSLISLGVVIGLAVLAGACVFQWKKHANIPAGLGLLALTEFYLLPYFANVFSWSQSATLGREACSLIVAVLTGMLVALLLCGQARRVSALICLVGTAQAVYALCYYKLGINGLQSGTVLRGGGTFAHPDGLYVLMLAALPLAVSQFLVNMRAKDPNAPKAERGLLSSAILIRAFWLPITAILFLALLSTWYRGAMIGLAIGITWMVFGYVPGRRMKTCVCLGLMLIVVVVFHHRMAGAVNASSAQRSVSGRRALWAQAWSVFRQHPLSGVGAGALALPVVKRAWGRANASRTEIHHEPNNLLLLWLAERGIVGGIVFALYMAVIAYTIQQARSWPGTADAAAGLGAVWIAYLVASLFDTPFGTAFRYSGNVLFGLLLGTTLLLSREVEMAKRRPNPE